jgi:hypothetical protein
MNGLFFSAMINLIFDDRDMVQAFIESQSQKFQKRFFQGPVVENRPGMCRISSSVNAVFINP